MLKVSIRRIKPELDEQLRKWLCVLKIRLSICDLSFLEAQPSDIKEMYISVALSIEDSNGLTIYPEMIADAFLLKLKSGERYQDGSYGKNFFLERLESMGKCMEG